MVGTRPQYIKLASVHRALERQGIEHSIVDTGQHYLSTMAECFFTELTIPEPNLNREVGLVSRTRRDCISRIIVQSEVVKGLGNFDFVLVYGDTNSTVGAALACRRHSLGHALVHVEAGLRSGLESQPEEQNRFIADHIADLNLAPTLTAMTNLQDEGLGDTALLIGDVLLDLFVTVDISDVEPRVVSGANDKILCTLHRAENIDDPDRLRRLVKGLENFGKTIIVPMHPRLKIRLEQSQITLPPQVEAVGPLSYGEARLMLRQVAGVVTDSGGLSREAAWTGVKCLLVRDVTEFPELVNLGCVSLDPELIQTDFFGGRGETPDQNRVLEAFGRGVATQRLVQALVT